jgi:hypothetical protein
MAPEAPGQSDLTGGTVEVAAGTHSGPFLFGDRILYVTAEELGEPGRRVREMVEVYFERQVRPELRPAGSRRVTYLHLAFPNDAGRGATAR